MLGMCFAHSESVDPKSGFVDEALDQVYKSLYLGSNISSCSNISWNIISPTKGVIVFYQFKAAVVWVWHPLIGQSFHGSSKIGPATHLRKVLEEKSSAMSFGVWAPMSSQRGGRTALAMLSLRIGLRIVELNS